MIVAEQSLFEIASVLRAARSSSRQCLQLTIQGLIDSWLERGLRAEPEARAAWSCRVCSAGSSKSFRRNGYYRRSLATLSGVIELRIPRLRCSCGSHVPLRFPVLEPRRRYWWDVWLNVFEGFGERVSVWHLAERLARRGLPLSRATLVRWLAKASLPPLGPLPGQTDEIQVDALHGHLWGRLPHLWSRQAFALVIAANRDPRCPEKVLGAVLAAEEDREAYRSLADLLIGRGLPADQQLVVMADGAAPIRSGMQVSLPQAQFARCLWHLQRLVVDLAPPQHKQAVGRQCKRVLWSESWDEALERYSAFRQRWLALAPESCQALAAGFEDAMLPLLTGQPIRQRTNGLAERMAREFRRFLRPKEAFRGARTAPAHVAIAVAQINARHKRQDWLPPFLGAQLGLPQRLTEFQIPLHT